MVQNTNTIDSNRQLEINDLIDSTAEDNYIEQETLLDSNEAIRFAPGIFL